VTPPLVVEAFVSGISPDRDTEHELLGDLTEEWSERAARDGRTRADWWYVREAARTAPHLVGLWWRRSRWFAVPALLLVALALRAVMIALGYLGLLAVIAIAETVGAVPHVTAAGSVLVLAAAAAATGALAVRIARRAPLVLLAILGLATAFVTVSITGLNAVAFPAPAAYGGVAHTLMLPSLALGALLSLRARRRAAGHRPG
jgi:hypothetical protein